MKLDYKLQDNEVAILWLETQDVEIMNIEGIDKIEDVRQYLKEEHGLDMNNTFIMT